MSAYMEFTEIQFANAALLVQALQEMGYTVETGKSLALYGYRGRERPERAQIVVRRDQVGSAANDLGFRWDKDKQAFIPIISEYDARTNLKAKWRERLQATYSKLAVTKFIQSNQGNVKRFQKGPDGTILIRATVEV